MATIGSTSSGNWEDGSTWVGGVVPTVGDKVVINNGNIVTLNSSIDVGNGSTQALYINDGTLKINRTNDIDITVDGRIDLDTDGILDIGTEADPVLGNITFYMNKSDVQFYGIRFTTNFSFYAYGKAKTTNTVCISDSVSTSDTIEVEDATGWEAGDEIVITYIQTRTHPIIRIIDSITPTAGGYNVTFTSVLGSNIYTEAPIGNLTKNIVFTKHASATGQNTVMIFESFTGSTPDCNVNHIQIYDLGTTSSGNYQCSFNLSNANGDFGMNFKDIVIYANNTSSRAIDVNNYRDSTSNFQNFNICIRGGAYVVRARTGATIEIKDSVVYDGGEINYGYSQGSSGMTWTRCKFMQRRSSVAFSFTTVAGYFYDCLFVCSSDSRAIYVADIGLLGVYGCTFGKNTGGWNITYSRAVDLGGAGYQTNIEMDSNIYTNDADGVEYIGGSSLQACSPSSYGTDLNYNLTELNRVYKPTGVKSQITSDFVLGEQSVEFENNDNVNPLVQIYTAIIPSDVPSKVSGFFKIATGYSGTPKPSVSVTSPSGINESVELSGAVDTWHSFEIPIVQTTGSNEKVTITYSTTNERDMFSYLDCVIVGAYGYSNIKSVNPAVSNGPTPLIGSMIANPLVTQDESTASSHTGISISETPVTWNSKDFEITITGNLTTNPSLTLEDIEHYLYYNFNRIEAYGGRSSGFLWEDILPLTSSETVMFNSKGVRVIDENGEAFPGVLRMQSNDGSYYISPIKRNLTTDGLFANSRVQVYNVTTDTELYNTTYATDLNIEYVEGVNITSGDTIRFRITYANGTSYKEPLELFSVASSGGVSVLVSQVDWTEVNALSIDGSTVSEYSTDFVNIQVDINDSDNVTTKKRLVGWYAYTIYNSSQSIAQYFGGITVEDSANYRVNVDIVNLKLENVKTEPLIFIDTDTRLYTSDGSSLFATTGGSIYMDSGKVYQLNVNVDAVQSVVDDINTIVNTIDTKVDVIDTNVDSLLTNVDTIDTNIDNLIVTTDSIETKIDTTLTNIATSDGKIDVIDNKVDILDTNIDGLIISTGVIDTNIDTTLTNLTTIESKIDIIDTNVDTSLVDLTSLDTLIDVLTSNLSVVDGKIDIIDTNVDEIETLSSSSNTKILDLAKTLLNRSKIDTGNNTLVIYEDNGVDIAFVFDLKDANNVATSTQVYERIPQ